jgi:hypothetical protein
MDDGSSCCGLYNTGRGIALDSNGNIYTTGYFAGVVDFDPGPGTFYLWSEWGMPDIFISKLDSNGGFVWAKSMGAGSDDIGHDIAVDSSDNVYTTGHFGGTVDFDPGPGTFNLTSVGGVDIFVSKLQADVAPIFADVPFSYWANDFIERLYNAGVTGGCSTNPLNYCPDTVATRDQMAVIILRAKHGDAYTPPAALGNVFGDVPFRYWASAWIEALANEGITGGCGSGNYCPDVVVTRAQMAVFLLVARHGSGYVPPAATGTMFGDVPASHWAAVWIEQLAAEGITAGCAGGNYCPDIPVTRAEMAVFLVRTFNLP